MAVNYQYLQDHGPDITEADIEAALDEIGLDDEKIYKFIYCDNQVFHKAMRLVYDNLSPDELKTFELHWGDAIDQRAREIAELRMLGDV